MYISVCVRMFVYFVRAALGVRLFICIVDLLFELTANHLYRWTFGVFRLCISLLSTKTLYFVNVHLCLAHVFMSRLNRNRIPPISFSLLGFSSPSNSLSLFDSLIHYSFYWLLFWDATISFSFLFATMSHTKHSPFFYAYTVRGAVTRVSVLPLYFCRFFSLSLSLSLKHCS